MQVQFSIDEVMTMADAVLDGLLESKFGRKDAAAIRRWRNEQITTTSGEMQLLAEKVNREIQRTHDHSLKSGIQKPDWV
jgi:hypothetical protein